MNILITGAAGSAGSYLIEHLLAHRDAPACVYALYRTPTVNLNGVKDRIQHLSIDLTDFSKVKEVFRHHHFDQVYHLASNADVKGSFEDPVGVLSNNVLGTAHLLEALRLSGQRPRFLMCSTSEVYGQARRSPISEDHESHPASPYGVSKACQDQLSAVYERAYGLPVIRTRMFTYLNPRRANLFATSFALQVAEIECGLRTELVHGNLDSIRTFVDVRDAMSAYQVAMEKGKVGEVYNISGTETLSVGDFLNLLVERARTKIPTRLDPALLRPVDVTLQIADGAKFARDTGWKPRHSLRESVDHLLDACRRRVKGEFV